MFVRIPGTNLLRDTVSMGLTVENGSEKNEYYAKRRMLQIQKQEINKLSVEMDAMRNEVSQINDTLATILNLLSKGSNG
jgi:hypothetical protein